MGNNPFIPEPPKAPPSVPDIHDVIFGSVDVMEGPQSPELAPPGQPTGEPWQQGQVAGDDRIAVIGLHGGAGASTVVSLLGETAFDAGREWPVNATAGVVAVCRTHGAGLEAGFEFAHQWAAGQLEGSRLLGLVLVDDAPQLAVSQVKAVKALARMTPHGWHLPWMEEWRVAPPDEARLPGRVKRIVKSVKKTSKLKEKK